MTTAYFDCFAGAGGDMIVASLLDAGCPLEPLQENLARLAAAGEFSVAAEPAHRQGLAATRFCVTLTGHDHAHRHLSDILDMIAAADLPARAAERAGAIFTNLARAEAQVHGCGIEQVHFHEVGALDSIADIVGAALALELLNVDRVECSPLPTGHGFVDCDHGRMPVPAPATAELLRGVPLAGTDIPFEAVTPTAAAILTTLAERFGPPPEMTLSAVGCGAGTREQGPLPNVLRVLLGDSEADTAERDSVWELATNLDDCTGELIAAAIEAALQAGALDAWATPATMKKSRPGWVLSMLCHPADADAVEAILFKQTPTFGIRRRPWQRSILKREHETVETPFGPVRVKLGRRGGQLLVASPEFADCQAAAACHHVAVREVFDAARAAFTNRSCS